MDPGLKPTSTSRTGWVLTSDGFVYPLYLEDLGNSSTPISLSITEMLANCAGAISVGELEEEESLKILPNPTRDKFKLNFDAKEDTPFNLTIINIHGQTIIKSVMFQGSDLEIDLSAQPAGIYFVRVESELETYYRKVIKN